MAAISTSSLIDPKQRGKRAQYDGQPDKRASWRFKFEAWCGLLPDQGTSVPLDLMDKAVVAASVDEVSSRILGTEATAVSLSLYYTLVQMVAGRALMIVRKTDRGNGLMSRRKFKTECGDRRAQRSRC